MPTVTKMILMIKSFIKRIFYVLKLIFKLVWALDYTGSNTSAFGVKPNQVNLIYGRHFKSAQYFILTINFAIYFAKLYIIL